MTVIAMTREIGSRGMDVAERVASKLELKIIRSEMVADRVAKRLGIDAQAFLRYMDGNASLLERWRIDLASSYTTRARKFCAWLNKATS